MGNQRSLTTHFKADSTSFKKGVDQMVQALEKANKELVDNQYRQRDCNKVISDAQKEINKLKKEEKEKGQLDEKQKKQLEELNSTIESEKVKLAQLRTEQAAIKGTIGDLSKEIAGNNKEWTTLKATIANLASDGVELLARKLLELGKATIAVGEQFSSSMSEVGAISGASAEQLELLEQTARDYGATTKFSASESAQALKYMALAGWDTQQSIASLGSVLDLAAAGNMDLARASDIVTDYITAFGLSAEDSAHFVDVMAYAMAHSNTNVEQLGEAYKNCAASAASMGFSLEDVTAVLMTMANAGVKGGEAGTTLNAIMTRLATDTKGCATELHNMGIEIFDKNDNLKSLSEILQLVSSAFNGLSDKSDATLAKIIAGQNQYTGLQTILKGLSEQAELAGASFNDYSKALEECDGTSEGMAKTMSDNLSGDLKTMQSAFEELALKIYDSGETPLRELVRFVTNGVIPALDELIKHMDIIVPVFVAAASAVGTYKAALGIMSIVKGITQATAALTAAKEAEKVATDEATTSQAALNTVQAANPIGLVVSAIGLLIGGLTSYAIIASQAADKTVEFNNSLTRATDAAASVQSTAIAETKLIETLGEEYEKLRKKNELNAFEKQRLADLAKQLQSKLGLEANEVKNVSGEYQNLKDKILEVVGAMKAEAEMNAVKAGYQVAYEELLKKEEQYYFKLAEIRKKHPDLYDENGNLDRSKWTYETDDAVQEVTQLQDAMRDAASAVEFYDGKMNDVTESQSKTSQNTNLFKASVSTTADSVASAAQKVEKSAKKVVKEQDNFNKTMKESQSIFKQDSDALKNLADQYNSVANGQMMSLDALVDLSLQYPRYSAEVVSANGSLEAQKNVLNKVFEAKKNDLKATIDKMKAEKEAKEAERDYLSNYIHSLEALKNSGASIDSQVIDKLNSLKEQFAEINSELSSTPGKIAAFENAVNLLSSIGVSNYGSDTNVNNYNPSQISSSTDSAQQWTWGWLDETATGATSAEARMNLVERVAELGKITQRELRDEYRKILSEEQLTADESYNIRLKLKNMTDKLQQAEFDVRLKAMDDRKALGMETLADEVQQYKNMLRIEQMTAEQRLNIQKRLYDAEKQLRQQRLDAARAAYEKLTKDRTKTLEDANAKLKADSDAAVSAIDEEMKRHEQQRQDAERKKQLDEIQGRLDFDQLDRQTRRQLLRQKQDIINEQAEADYERSMEQKKLQIQEKANAEIDKNTEAIERLNSNLDVVANLLAKANGSQTVQQIVNNNSRNANVQLIQQGVTDDQLLKKIMDMLYSG